MRLFNPKIERILAASMFVAVASIAFGAFAVVTSHALLTERETAYNAARDLDVSEGLPVFGVLPMAPSRTESASLFIAGDIMLDRTVRTRIDQSGNDAYPFARMKQDTRFIDPDVRLANLEGPLTSRRAPPEKEIDFQFDPRFASMLRTTGFDILSQANNHTLDQGRAGAEESRRVLQESGMLAFGDEVREDAVSFVTSTIRGRRMAFVGFNETSDGMDEAAGEEVLREANLAADTVIAFMHWGEEYRSRPTRSQESRARWLIDRGVDVVIGAHPHWVQSISSYQGKPILYSLGNFVFDQDWSVETRQGLAAGLRIADTGIAIELYPVQIDKSQPFFVEGSVREERLRDLASISDASLLPQILQGEIVFPTP
jgi:poly-gamma-glutamate capsule biosynthesis protein CapA/YwtB (metallophosphatase superfamily)